MTTDIHALQREYASQKRQHRKHQHIILTGSVKESQGQSSIRPDLAEDNTRVDPLTIATISIETGNSFHFLDSITPQVIGETKCILVQQTKHKATKHIHKEADTSTSQSKACGRRRATISKERRGRSLSVPAVINEERPSVDLPEGVTDEVDEDVTVRSELENDTIYGKSSENTGEKMDNPDRKDISGHVNDDVFADNRHDELEQSCSVENQISEMCSIKDKEGMQCLIHEEDREPTCKPNKKENGEIMVKINRNKNEQVKHDLNGSVAVEIGTACEASDDLHQQCLNSNHLRNARSHPKFARSLSFNFESSVQKDGLKVNSEVKANIYHHFNTKKRNLSINSEFGCYNNDHSADARILKPFPVQHLNKKQNKGWCETGFVQK